MYRKVLKISQASELVGLSRTQVYRLVRAGRIWAFKTGRHTSPWRFPRGLLLNWYLRRSFQRWRRQLATLLIKEGSDGHSCLPRLTRPKNLSSVNSRG